MNKGDEFQVTIEKMSNLGTGITYVNGIIVFVSNACPGDTVKIKITNVSKSFANAEVLELISPSQFRIQPICSLQKVCGACQIQFIDYKYQLEIKRKSVQDALYTIAGIEFDVPLTVPSPQRFEYRHKIQYPVSQTKVSKRLIAGYYKPQSHEIVNIKHCPIQPAVCDEIVEYIRNNFSKFGLSGYNEKKHSGCLRHIVLRISSSTGKILLTLVINSKKLFKEIDNLAKSLYDSFDCISGVCINFNTTKSNLILSDETICVQGEQYITENMCGKLFNIGADTFFQVNPKSAENIFSYVKNEVAKLNTPTVLDAYAGIAVFGLIVSDVSSHVISVESNKHSISNAEQALKVNAVTNVELFAEDTYEYLKRVKRKFDVTILDPPRKGCSELALDETLKHTKNKIIYVSCNPQTLARDLKFLLAKGCKLESVQPFDMFCHTYHVETVAVISCP